MSYTLDQISTLGPTLRAIVVQLFDEGLATGIASARRDVDAQAHAMAVNEAARPGWVAGTYRASPVRDAVVAALSALVAGVRKMPGLDIAGWTDSHVYAAAGGVPALETAILGALATQGLDLRELSWHLPDAAGLADAVDLLPVGDGPLAARARQLVAAAVAAGADPRSCVLTDEAGHVCCHVQVA